MKRNTQEQSADNRQPEGQQKNEGQPQSGQQVYEMVADAYGAYWPEQPMDKARTIMQLEEACRQVPVSVLVSKARSAARSHGENRCKLSLLVADGYWRRKYPCESDPSFTIRRHNPDQT